MTTAFKRIFICLAAVTAALFLAFTGMAHAAPVLTKEPVIENLVIYQGDEERFEVGDRIRVDYDNTGFDKPVAFRVEDENESTANVVLEEDGFSVTRPGWYCIRLLYEEDDGSIVAISAQWIEVFQSVKTPLYRLFNPNSGEHLYTTSAAERANVIRVGWRDEGTAYYVASGRDVAAVPVYRLYNPNTGEHHYTQDDSERAHLVTIGWRDEGTAFAVPTDGIAVYRLYNPKMPANNHHYTADENEYRHLLRHGWRDEGRCWYAAAIDK